MVDEPNSGTLTDRYKSLKMQSFMTRDDDPAAGELERELDALFKRIVAAPVVDLASVLEKLRFAHHCLTEEEDFKEVANLLSQVCLALEGRFRDQRHARAAAAKVRSFRFCRLPQSRRPGAVIAMVVRRPAVPCEENGRS